jgi:ribosomal protein S18 acetylase RimI-like enzyme
LPAAWVRAAALDQVRNPAGVLAAMMERATTYLQQLGVTELAWLASEMWPDNYAPQLGFRKAYAIVTYIKDDLTIPDHRQATIDIRPARSDDLPLLAEMEVGAFHPLWRHSAESLRLARHQSLSFDVAEIDGRIVAFQYSVLGHSGLSAHLVRMTVSPELQGAGIGSTLLAHAIDGYRQHRLTGVSLNTQTNNDVSQRLYEKFGFRQSGERLPVWVLTL